MVNLTPSYMRAMLGLVLLTMSMTTYAQQQRESSSEDDALDALFDDMGGEDRASYEPSREPPSEPEDTASAGEVIQLKEKPVPSVTPAPRSRRIEEIVVTATKREASLRDIPATIVAFDGEALENAGVQELADLVKLTPGVNLADDGVNAKRVTIRGVAASATLNFTTGTFIGDVPFSDPFSPRVALDPNPFDMQSVEVLKGPQGTLFGGSGLNGAVRYVPTPPQFDGRQLRYYAQYQSFQHGGAAPSYGAVFNQPLGRANSTAIRLMAFRRDKAGVIDELGRGERDVNDLAQSGLRGQFAWEPSDRLRMDAIWTQQTSNKGDIDHVGPEEAENGRLERANTPVEGFTDSRYQLGSIKLAYEFDWAVLMALSAATDKTWDNLSDLSRLASGEQESLILTGNNLSRSRIHELRLTSPGNGTGWEWVAGIFYSGNTLDDQLDLSGSHAFAVLPELNDDVQNLGAGLPSFEGVLTQDGRINGGHFELDARTTELAVFGEASRPLGERWRVTLGLRSYQTEIDGVSRASGALNVAAFGPGETESTNENLIKESGLSPKLSASFDWTEAAMMYVTAARGYRFGGLQLVTQAGPDDVPDTYSSDSIWSYELGWRTSWLSGSLQFDGAAFFVDWETPQIVRPAGGGVFNVIENVGGARSQGVEFAVNYLPPIDGLSLLLSGSIVDTVTTEPFPASTNNFGSGDSSGSDSGELPAGQRWPLAPKFQSLASVNYARDFGPWTPSVTLSHSYLDDAFQDLDNTGAVFGYGTWSMQLGLVNTRRPNWPELTLNATNLTDERGVSALVQGLQDTIFIPPRAVMLRLSGRF